MHMDKTSYHLHDIVGNASNIVCGTLNENSPIGSQGVALLGGVALLE